MIYYKWLNRLHIYQWKKRYQIDKHLKHIEYLYQNINGYGISKAAREHQPALEYTYGEVNLESFLALLSLVHPTTEDIFYDLGSGLGKTVIACSLVYELKKCCGIEYIADLYQTACQLSHHLSTPTQLIEYQQQHILQANWDDASIIFINVASFLPEVWQDINHKINLYQTPTIISCAKPLQLSTAYHHTPTQVASSWGIIPAHIYQLKTKINKKI
jgi:hypothetical protein